MPAAMVADRPIKAIKNLAAVRFCVIACRLPFIQKSVPHAPWTHRNLFASAARTDASAIDDREATRIPQQHTVDRHGEGRQHLK